MISGVSGQGTTRKLLKIGVRLRQWNLAVLSGSREALIAYSITLKCKQWMLQVIYLMSKEERPSCSHEIAFPAKTVTQGLHNLSVHWLHRHRPFMAGTISTHLSISVYHRSISLIIFNTFPDALELPLFEVDQAAENSNERACCAAGSYWLCPGLSAALRRASSASRSSRDISFRAGFTASVCPESP